MSFVSPGPPSSSGYANDQMVCIPVEEADKEEAVEQKADPYRQFDVKKKEKDTAFEDMKTESLADVSTKIISKANKSWFKGLMPDFGVF